MVSGFLCICAAFITLSIFIEGLRVAKSALAYRSQIPQRRSPTNPIQRILDEAVTRKRRLSSNRYGVAIRKSYNYQWIKWSLTNYRKYFKNIVT